MNDSSIDPRDFEVNGFLEVMTFLGKTELIAQLGLVHNGEPITQSRVYSRLAGKFAAGSSVGEEITFVAAQFSELDCGFSKVLMFHWWNWLVPQRHRS
jgi:hypothetical protein